MKTASSSLLMITALLGAILIPAHPASATSTRSEGVHAGAVVPGETVQARAQTPFLVCVYIDGQLAYCEIWA